MLLPFSNRNFLLQVVPSHKTRFKMRGYLPWRDGIFEDLYNLGGKNFPMGYYVSWIGVIPYKLDLTFYPQLAIVANEGFFLRIHSKNSRCHPGT